MIPLACTHVSPASAPRISRVPQQRHLRQACMAARWTRSMMRYLWISQPQQGFCPWTAKTG